MGRFLLGTNWKMHKSFAEAAKYMKRIRKIAEENPEIQFFMIPPYTHLDMVKKSISDTDILLGAQNMHWEEEGNYTGEISPQWLEELGVQIAELGHSERRRYYNEKDIDLNKKAVAALKHGMIPLLCVGEQADDKAYGVTAEVIRRQIKIAMFGLNMNQISRFWIAYEPAWAIGPNGTVAEPRYVESVHTMIREQLEELTEGQGQNVPILYGGSVNPDNCRALSQCQNVNGLFVGRAAWDVESFQKIIKKIFY